MLIGKAYNAADECVKATYGYGIIVSYDPYDSSFYSINHNYIVTHLLTLLISQY